MRGRERRRRGLGIILPLLLLAAALTPAAAAAQTVRDGSLGPPCAGSACALAGPDFVIGAELGRISGSNLFHSFAQFNVLTGESATFSGPSSIANILSRVTGTQQSFIDGLLRSTISGANLFLLNPRGVVFGPNASLDVSGSFHVSTADYLRFSDGAQFFADLSKQSVLTVAQPAAFGFLTATPAPIEVRGSFLQVPERQTLSIIGGDIKIAPPPDGPSGAFISAPAGRIQIASVASAGEVVPSPPGSAPGLDVSSFARLGRIDISASSLDVSEIFGTGGGTVLIRGGQLFVDASAITSNVFGDVTGEPLGVDLRVTGETALTGGTSIAAATFFGQGRSGDINLAAGDLRIDGSSVASSTFLGTGTAGNVTITADRLTLANGGAVLSENQSFAPARGGDVTVRVADSIAMSGQAGILSTSGFSGDGGDLAVSARSLTMDGRTTILSAASGDGRGGSIGIKVERLNISDGARVDSSGGLTGQGGTIAVDATESTLISGIDSLGNTSGIFSSSGGAPVGPILLTTGTLNLRDGARIQSGSVLAAQGGDITVRASGDILISNGGGILSQTFDQPVGRVSVSAQALTLDNGFITTSTLGPGRAGAIEVKDVATLALLNGGQIVSSSEVLAGGDGGSVNVAASQSVTISGRVPTEQEQPASPFSTDRSSGIFSTAAATGNAGQIAITTPALILTDGGKISVATSGSGRAGDIVLNVGNFSLTGGALVDSSTIGSGPGGAITVTATDAVSLAGPESGLFSTAGRTGDEIESTGNAGQIALSAPTLTMGDGSTISVATVEAGRAGNILLNVSNFSLTGGARVDSSTTGAGLGGNVTVNATGSVSTSGLTTGLFSTAASTGDAGQISVSASTVSLVDGGTISVDTAGAGRAGNISVTTSQLALANGATIDSSTTAAGAGGNINITANSVTIGGAGGGLFSTAESSGAAGQISVFAPTVGLTNDGEISVATFSSSPSGRAGDISLNVANLTLDSGGAVDSSTFGAAPGGAVAVTATSAVSVAGLGSGLFSTAASTGDAGQISVSAPTVSLVDGGTISVDTAGAGRAGNISLNVSDFTLTGGARVDSSTSGAGLGGNVTVNAAGSVSISGLATGLFSTAESAGNAGQIVVSAPTLAMSEGGQISVATSSAGRAGDVALDVSNFTLASGARVDSSTRGAGEGGTVTINAASGLVTISGGAGVFSNAEGSGPGGDINIQAAELQLLTGGTISAKSTGTVDALAGNVNLVIGDTLAMDGGIITTDAAVADGGNISITTTGSLVHLIDSQITTSVRSGVGQGGNITIGSTDHPLDFVVLNNSQIRADAFGGPGGNIDIFANVYLTSDSVVSASSALGVPGTIEIQATVTDVSGGLVQLPEAVLQAATLLRASCAARLAEGKASSLVLAGRDGLPLEPSGLLPSPLLSAGAAGAPPSRSEEHWWEMVPRFAWSVLNPQCSR